MPYVCKRDNFTVTVNSGFISDWQWAGSGERGRRSSGCLPRVVRTEKRG
jgi:hypothetical protein